MLSISTGREVSGVGARSPGLEGTPCVRRTEGERDDGQQTRNAKRGVRCPRAGESDAEADSLAGRAETRLSEPREFGAEWGGGAKGNGNRK